MATNTIRLHLNTADGELEEVDNVKNHANCKFNLARATISAISDQILSIALVKAVIPSNTTSIGYDNNKASFGIGDVKLFITSSKTVLPVSGADVYIPLTFIHGPKEILDLLNSIHKINNPTEGCLVIDEIDKTLKIDPLYPSTNYRINNRYFIKSNPLFSVIGLKIAQILGINTDTDVDETVFGATPKNLDILYQVGLAQVPLKLATNLGLDSVLSGIGSRNNILSNIPINISNQSQVIDVEFETTDPVPPVASTIESYTLTVDNHPYTPALDGDYISVGNYYRDPSPPRYFKESDDHHLFRMDTDDNTYLLFSYGIHETATWYIGIYPLLDINVDYLSHNHTSLGQISQHSIGIGWNAFTGGGIGNYPSAAYTPSHTLTGIYSS